MNASSPFHAGEQLLQTQVGKRKRMEAIGRQVIRDYMPDQHREFFTLLPFLVVGSVDAHNQPQAALLTGQTGFVQSLDERTLHIDLRDDRNNDALSHLSAGAPVGLLGIELATRRRNRANGIIRAIDANGLTVDITESFGNCPQYIQSRSVVRIPECTQTPTIQAFGELPADANRLIDRTDTLFVASFLPTAAGTAASVDVSHRGGLPGFVGRAGDTLTIPDYRGNNFFNTLGNFVVNPIAGLAVPDFERGDLLQLSGEVKLHTETTDEPGFETGRYWQVKVTQGRWLRGALPFDFGPAELSPRLARSA